MDKVWRGLAWGLVAILGASSLGGIALVRGEQVDAIWFVIAAVSTYLIAYRFYSLWITHTVLVTDATRATPAERLNDGRDYVPTNRWIVFGHHFAAIAGPGPLIGPTLAAQFGYLPGTIWILVGAVLGGCVQDMVILFLSVRRNGRSLGQIAREELGPIGGYAALIATMVIMIILIAVLGLVVVKAMHHSPWATATVFFTIPVAMIVGVYLRYIRIGRVGEATALGFALLMFSVWAGEWVQNSPEIAPYFNWEAKSLAAFVIGYGFCAAVLPVWLLLAPRDYLSTFLKLGVVILLAIAICITNPAMQMPPLTRFIDGTGPIFGGTIFPFLFITIACGAVSGFHALISSGTTSKIIMNERDIRMVGYGSMALESFVGVMAMIAACILSPGVYFAINSPAGVVGADPATAVATITSWGFPVTVAEMQQLATDMGEGSLFGRTGGAPSLAVGMAMIFGHTFGQEFLALWYHFAIMFEAVFILTALDAGTRVARFMLQDFLGNVYRPLGQTSRYPAVLFSSALVVGMWGYFLYAGVIDPKGGINILWPLFGISNQILAGVALCVATACIIKSGKMRYAFVTAVPLTWLLIVTSTAGLQKTFSPSVNIGYLAGARDWSEKLASGILDNAKVEIAERMIFNNYLLAGLTMLFLLLFWTVVIDTLRTAFRIRNGKSVLPLAETPYEPTALQGRDALA